MKALEIAVPALAILAATAMYSTLDEAPRAARAVPLGVCALAALLAAVQLARTIFAASFTGGARSPGAGQSSRLAEPESGPPTASIARRIAALPPDAVREACVLALMVGFPFGVSAGGFAISGTAFVALVALLCGAGLIGAGIVAFASVGAVLGGMMAAGFHFPL